MAPFRKSVSALLVGFSLSQAVWSLGFGDLQLQSQLNQPLQAEIPILGVPAYASDAIRVRVGKREDFSALGYDYSPEMADIRTELTQRDNRLVLQLSSRNALREPLLQLVLVAEDGSTRYLRDYAILLDLPGTHSGVSTATNTATSPVAITPAPVSTPSAEAGAAVTVSALPVVVVAESAGPSVTTAEADPVRAASATPARAIAAETPSETVYGPTRPGDSLSIIAHRLGKARGDEWHAFGVALYHANPEAFIAGDPNRLKAAMPLRLPAAAEVQRYQRRDWLALFADNGQATTGAAAVTTTALPSATPATSVPVPTVSEPINSNTVPKITGGATASVSAPSLQILQQENAQLKADLQSASARMQALEVQLAKLDARYAELSQPAAPADASSLNATPLDTAPVEATAAASETVPVPANPIVADNLALVATAAPVSAPVTVQIRDTLAATDTVPAETVPTETPASASSINANPTTPVNASSANSWKGAVWSLLIVLGLTIAGVLFWQWSERRQPALQARKTRAPRMPRPVLPAAELDEAAALPVDVGSPDRRMLKLKQVQAALETYVTYQRFDRALELLEHEMHVAGDDLVLRRQLQRLQKQVKQDQLAWQQTHSEQLSEQFDRATVTHVDKPAGRDESKKTSG